MIALKKRKSEKANDGEFTLPIASECWTNFILNVWDQFAGPIYPGPPNIIIRNELTTNYGGTLFVDYVKFETGEQLAFFILKFS